jgi:hypothetical protein
MDERKDTDDLAYLFGVKIVCVMTETMLDDLAPTCLVKEASLGASLNKPIP